MKLYTNMKAEWFGTQADAKAAGVEWWGVNVPTDKPNLIRFLSGKSFNDPTPDTPTAAPVVHQSTLTKSHPWQTIKECAEQASLRDLGVALAVVMNRLEEAAEREEIS